MYELTVEEHQFSGEESSFPILSRFRTVAIEEDSLDIRLLQDSEVQLDDKGHVSIDSALQRIKDEEDEEDEPDDGPGLDTAQLAELIMALEKIPDRWAFSAEEE